MSSVGSVGSNSSLLQQIQQQMLAEFSALSSLTSGTGSSQGDDGLTLGNDLFGTSGDDSTTTSNSTDACPTGWSQANLGASSYSVMMAFVEFQGPATGDDATSTSSST